VLCIIFGFATLLTAHFFNGHKNVRSGFGSGPVIKWPPDSGSGSAIKNYRFGDPDPSELFTNLEHCLKLLRVAKNSSSKKD
jgi:hypothetical protein